MSGNGDRPHDRDVLSPVIDAQQGFFSGLHSEPDFMYPYPRRFHIIRMEHLQKHKADPGRMGKIISGKRGMKHYFIRVKINGSITNKKAGVVLGSFPHWVYRFLISAKLISLKLKNSTSLRSGLRQFQFLSASGGS